MEGSLLLVLQRLLQLWQMQQGKREIVGRNRCIFLQKLKNKKTVILFPISGSLTVTSVGDLGMDVIFMGNNLLCLRNVNDGKKRPLHIRQCALHEFGQRQRDQAEWFLIQTFCFPYKEGIKTEGSGNKICERLFQVS